MCKPAGRQVGRQMQQDKISGKVITFEWIEVPLDGYEVTCTARYLSAVQYLSSSTSTYGIWIIILLKLPDIMVLLHVEEKKEQ